MVSFDSSITNITLRSLSTSFGTFKINLLHSSLGSASKSSLSTKIHSDNFICVFKIFIINHASHSIVVTITNHNISKVFVSSSVYFCYWGFKNFSPIYGNVIVNIEHVRNKNSGYTFSIKSNWIGEDEKPIYSLKSRFYHDIKLIAC